MRSILLLALCRQHVWNMQCLMRQTRHKKGTTQHVESDITAEKCIIWKYDLAYIENFVYMIEYV